MWRAILYVNTWFGQVTKRGGSQHFYKWLGGIIMQGDCKIQCTRVPISFTVCATCVPEITRLRYNTNDLFFMCKSSDVSVFLPVSG